MLISWHSGPVVQTGRADSPSQKKVPMLAVKVGPQACADVGGAKGSWPDSICCLPRRPHGRNTRSVKMRQNDGAKPDGAWALEPELPARNLVLPRGSSATSGRPTVLWLSFLICTRGEWQYRPPRTAGNIKRDSSQRKGAYALLSSHGQVASSPSQSSHSQKSGGAFGLCSGNPTSHDPGNGKIPGLAALCAQLIPLDTR